jgi:hypothetical protein
MKQERMVGNQCSDVWQARHDLNIVMAATDMVPARVDERPNLQPQAQGRVGALSSSAIEAIAAIKHTPHVPAWNPGTDAANASARNSVAPTQLSLRETLFASYNGTNISTHPNACHGIAACLPVTRAILCALTTTLVVDKWGMSALP